MSHRAPLRYATATAALLLLAGCVDDLGLEEGPAVADTASGEDTSLVQSHSWSPLPPAFAEGAEATAVVSSYLYADDVEVDLVFEDGQFVLDSSAPVVRPELYACGGVGPNTLTWDTMPRVMLQTNGWAFVLRPVWSEDYTWQGDAFPTTMPSEACMDQLEALGMTIPLHPTIELISDELE